MRAEYQYCSHRNFRNCLNENRASPPQLIDNVPIVHDFVMDVDRTPVRFESEFHDVNSPYDACAKPSRPDTYQRLAPAVQTLDIHQRQFASPRKEYLNLNARFPATLFRPDPTKSLSLEWATATRP